MMVDFLFWLVAETSETYTTSLLDKAGIAYFLTFLGFDILRVEGLRNLEDDPERAHSCLLIYSPNPLPKRLTGLVYPSIVTQRREINAVVLYPTPKNQCR